jgi:hypothetical protein
MTELLSKFNGGEIIGIVAVGGSMLVGIVAVIMGSWLESRKAEIAATLKQDMINRGMSAEDIRTVVDAGTKRSRKCGSKNSDSQIA